MKSWHFQHGEARLKVSIAKPTTYDVLLTISMVPIYQIRSLIAIRVDSTVEFCGCSCKQLCCGYQMETAHDVDNPLEPRKACYEARLLR